MALSPIAPPGLPSLDDIVARVTGQAGGLRPPAPGQRPDTPTMDSLMSPYVSAVGGRPSTPFFPMPMAGMGSPGAAPLPGSGGSSGSGIGPATGYVAHNGQAGNASQYGLDPENLDTRSGVTLVEQGMDNLIRLKQQLGPEAQGLFGNVVSDFRSREQQADLYARYLAGTGNLAAPPGSSMHEVGRALDINTEWLESHTAFRDALENAGWVNDVPGEPWHWEWQGPAYIPDKPRPYTPAKVKVGYGGSSSSGGSSSGSAPKRTRNAAPSYASSKAQRNLREGISSL